MSVIGLVWICAVLGVLPLVLRYPNPKGLIVGGVAFGLALLIGLPALYLGIPSTVYPLFGGVGLWVLFIWVVMAAIDIIIQVAIYNELHESSYRRKKDYPYKNSFPWIWILPAVFLVSLLIICIKNSEMFSAYSYAAMADQSEERVWTQDIQPKDPKHMLMGSWENAAYQAKNAIGQAGKIGSQYELSPNVTLQKISNEFWYVVPLDFRGFSVYNSVDSGVPAYIKVSAEDPNRQPILVELKDNKMIYTPGAYFNGYLLRHLRNHGYLNRDFYEYRFEIDEEGNPFWVVPAFLPQCGWWGEKITDLLIVNPATGEIKRYDPQAQPGSPEAVPDWVDRVYPGGLVEKYLSWRGLYHLGWRNTIPSFPFWGAQKDLTVPQSPILIYGAENQADWVTGMTSNNGSDSSLVSFVYTNSRTGKSVSYTVQGGTTESAVIAAVNNNEKIKFRQLHGVNPQLYNCEGVMASVVPLLNGNHIFQGVAIVDIMQTSIIAVGDDQYQALHSFQQLLAKSGQQVALSASLEVKELTAPVARLGFDHVSSAYFLYFAGVPHVFSLSSTNHPSLPLTQAGDSLWIKYENSGQRLQPVLEFVNNDLQLEATADENAVSAKAADRLKVEQSRNALPTVQENIKDKLKGMSTEELQQFEKQLNK